MTGPHIFLPTFGEVHSKESSRFITSPSPTPVLGKREFCDSDETSIHVLNKESQSWRPFPDQLPEVIQPEGLSLERKKYLYEKIREYVRPDCSNLVCPDPNYTSTSSNTTSSLPGSSTSSTIPSLSTSHTTSTLTSSIISSSTLPIPASKRRCHRNN